LLKKFSNEIIYQKKSFLLKKFSKEFSTKKKKILNFLMKLSTEMSPINKKILQQNFLSKKSLFNKKAFVYNKNKNSL
jgi:hypothetical protein